MDETLSNLATQLLSAVKGSLSDGAKAYIEANAPVKALLEDRAQRAAELSKEYLLAKDEDKPAIQNYMSIVYQTVRNETVAVILSAEPTLKAEILAAVQAAFKIILQNLPAIIALIPK